MCADADSDSSETTNTLADELDDIQDRLDGLEDAVGRMNAFRRRVVVPAVAAVAGFFVGLLIGRRHR